MFLWSGCNYASSMIRTGNKMKLSWEPTRAEGLRRLEQFTPRAGQAYAKWRNFDHGPGDRSNVSTLSPYIRHRLVREDEVATAVLEHMSFGSCEKFLQELCWRTYWKGWLELRPRVWNDYRFEVANLISALDRQQSLRARWEQATQGRTGISCFDAWTRELVETGYLHNHTRMWFASAWIHTLKLPWALGADFFFRHLLDGDAASNTLSWRWVAGLQTRGKTYLARPENIARYTLGRFRPGESLTEIAEAVDGPPPPRPSTLPPEDSVAEGSFGLLLTDEDLDPASLGLDPGRVAAVAGVLASSHRSPLPVGALTTAFASGAMDDALRRASATFAASTERFDRDNWHEQIIDWASCHSFRQVVTPYAPQGPMRERLDSLRESLGQEGVRLSMIRRPWDELFWPLATSGFFPFKEKIPACLDRLELRP